MPDEVNVYERIAAMWDLLDSHRRVHQGEEMLAAANARAEEAGVTKQDRAALMRLVVGVEVPESHCEACGAAVYLSGYRDGQAAGKPEQEEPPIRDTEQACAECGQAIWWDPEYVAHGVHRGWSHYTSSSHQAVLKARG